MPSLWKNIQNRTIHEVSHETNSRCIQQMNFHCVFRTVNKIDNILLQGFVAEEFISSGVDGRASCTICGKGFIQKSDAKRHIVAKHSGIEQQVECEFCGKTFKNKQSLGSHAGVAHNAYKTSI